MDEAPAPLRPRPGRLTLIFVLVVAVGLLGASLFSPRTPVEDQPGQVAAEIQVTTFDGDAFVLSRHLREDGRPVVLNLWASWCGPCRLEMPELDRLSQARPDVLVLGVAIEDTDVAARGFASEVDVGYPLALDSDGRVAAAYTSVGLPVTYVISSDGIVTYRFHGAVTFDRVVAALDS